MTKLKIRRRKLAVYFGNYISPEEVLLVYKAMDSYLDYDSFLKDNYKKFLNKRVLVSLFMFFERGYVPVFPEMFEYFSARVPYIGKLYFGEKIVKDLISRRNFPFTRDFLKKVFKNNISALEKILVNLSDLIINMMETNSAAVETGMYLNKETFKKTIIITPPENLVERKVVGEFTNKIIYELNKKSETDRDNYTRLSMFMEITKNKESMNTASFYTNFSRAERFNLLTKRLKSRPNDFSYWQNYRYIRSSDTHWYPAFLASRLLSWEKISKWKEIEGNKISYEEMVKSIYQSLDKKEVVQFNRKTREYLNSKIFDRTAIVLKGEEIFFYSLVSFILFQYHGNYNTNEYQTISVVKSYITKKGRKIYPQPKELEYSHKISGDMLQFEYETLLEKYELEGNVSAYRKRISIPKTVSSHNGSKFYWKYDIKKYFDSISINKLTETIKKENFNYSIPEEIVINGGIGIKQGFILSPILSNIFLLNFDKEIKKFADENHLIYTRYADDILISSKTATSINVGIEIAKHLKNIGLELNMEKISENKEQVRYLGLTFSKSGIKLSRRKKAMVRNVNSLPNKINAKRNYYRWLIKELEKNG